MAMSPTPSCASRVTSACRRSALQDVFIIKAPERRIITSSNYARAPRATSPQTIHAFDGASQRISFTWPGHTTSKQRVPVATVCEQLQAEAESRAQHQGMPIEQTPEHQDLRTIANLADDQVRIKHQAVAPHPRCTL